MHEVLVHRLGGLGLSRKSVVRLTDRPDMTLDVYRGRKTTIRRLRRDLTGFSCIYSHVRSEVSRCWGVCMGEEGV